MNRVIILLTFLIFTSCGQTDNKETNVDSSTKKGSLIKTVDFKKEENFELLYFIKSSDYPSSDKDTTACKNWTLSKTEIIRIIKNSEKISTQDWHHIFQHYPCIVRGQLIQNNKTFDFEINSGAWLTVDSVMYGDFNRNDDKLFMSTSLSGDEE